MFAACGTGISPKLSTSPSARCLAAHWLISWLPEYHLEWENRILAKKNHLAVYTFIIRNKIYRKSKVIAEQNIPFVSKPIDIHVRNGSNRSSTSKQISVLMSSVLDKAKKKRGMTVQKN